MTIRQEHSTKAQQVGFKTRREKRKKLFTCHRLSPVSDRTGRKPLKVLINQIGQNNMMVDIQESVRKLETRSYNVRKPVRYLSSSTPIHIDTPAARIIDAVPHLARELEDSTLNEQLSRVHHRIALADFYCAYRVAHAQSHTFLKEVDRHSSQHIHQAQSRNSVRILTWLPASLLNALLTLASRWCGFSLVAAQGQPPIWRPPAPTFLPSFLSINFLVS